jgi:hypothetical protein
LKHPPLLISLVRKCGEKAEEEGGKGREEKREGERKDSF